jgi:hypothetical protein
MANNIISHHNQPETLTADVPVERQVTPALDNPNNNNKKEENQMAEVDTYTLAGQHSDIRREAVEHTNEIVKEGLKGDYITQNAINNVERAQSTQIDMLEDVMNNQFSVVARDTADIRAQIISAQQQVVAGFLGSSKDAEINALRTQIELAKQTTYISDKVDAGNNDLRALINGLNDSNQNRLLVERNTELVAALNDGRWGRDWGHFRGGWDSNVQTTNSRLNSLDSQFSEARQGMVNFGTMAGVGQTSTNNNVK